MKREIRTGRDPGEFLPKRNGLSRMAGRGRSRRSPGLQTEMQHQRTGSIKRSAGLRYLKNVLCGRPADTREGCYIRPKYLRALTAILLTSGRTTAWEYHGCSGIFSKKPYFRIS